MLMLMLLTACGGTVRDEQTPDASAPFYPAIRAEYRVVGKPSTKSATATCEPDDVAESGLCVGDAFVESVVVPKSGAEYFYCAFLDDAVSHAEVTCRRR